MPLLGVYFLNTTYPYMEKEMILYEVKKYELEKADEMRILVIFLQTITKGHITYIAVCGRPRPKNENNTFGDTVVNACVSASKRLKKKPI